MNEQENQRTTAMNFSRLVTILLIWAIALLPDEVCSNQVGPVSFPHNEVAQPNVMDTGSVDWGHGGRQDPPETPLGGWDDDHDIGGWKSRENRLNPGDNFGGGDDNSMKNKLEHSIPGIPGQSYPNYERVPETEFDCRQQNNPGYYGDVEARCQVFHICQSGGRQNSFLCPVGTLFNQRTLVCDWWFNVNCPESPAYYDLNANLYNSQRVKDNGDVGYTKGVTTSEGWGNVAQPVADGNLNWASQNKGETRRGSVMSVQEEPGWHEQQNGHDIKGLIHPNRWQNEFNGFEDQGFSFSHDGRTGMSRTRRGRRTRGSNFRNKFWSRDQRRAKSQWSGNPDQSESSPGGSAVEWDGQHRKGERQLRLREGTRNGHSWPISEAKVVRISRRNPSGSGRLRESDFGFGARRNVFPLSSGDASKNAESMKRWDKSGRLNQKRSNFIRRWTDGYQNTQLRKSWIGGESRHVGAISTSPDSRELPREENTEKYRNFEKDGGGVNYPIRAQQQVRDWKGEPEARSYDISKKNDINWIAPSEKDGYRDFGQIENDRFNGRTRNWNED